MLKYKTQNNKPVIFVLATVCARWSKIILIYSMTNPTPLRASSSSWFFLSTPPAMGCTR